MSRLMALAVVVAIAASVAGLYLSYYASIAAGASVAVVMVGAYVAALAVRGAT